MKKIKSIVMILIMGSLVFVTSSCFNSEESESEHGTESSNEKSVEAGEKGHNEAGEQGEEDGTQFGINDSYNGVRNGVRMILAYDAESDAFVGTVENTTEAVIAQVRVEVHLSNSVELGPTPRADLAPGETRKIILSAEGNSFESWSTHAESGNSEEGHGEEGEGEHGGEGREEGGREHR